MDIYTFLDLYTNILAWLSSHRLLIILTILISFLAYWLGKKAVRQYAFNKSLGSILKNENVKSGPSGLYQDLSTKGTEIEDEAKMFEKLEKESSESGPGVTKIYLLPFLPTIYISDKSIINKIINATSGVGASTHGIYFVEKLKNLSKLLNSISNKETDSLSIFERKKKILDLTLAKDLHGIYSQSISKHVSEWGETMLNCIDKMAENCLFSEEESFIDLEYFKNQYSLNFDILFQVVFGLDRGEIEQERQEKKEERRLEREKAEQERLKNGDKDEKESELKKQEIEEEEAELSAKELETDFSTCLEKVLEIFQLKLNYPIFSYQFVWKIYCWWNNLVPSSLVSKLETAVMVLIYQRNDKARKEKRAVDSLKKKEEERNKMNNKKQSPPRPKNNKKDKGKQGQENQLEETTPKHEIIVSCIVDVLMDMYSQQILTYDDFIGEIITFFIAGLDTSTMLMSAIVYCLSNNDEKSLACQEKLRAEIDEYFPDSKEPERKSSKKGKKPATKSTSSSNENKPSKMTDILDKMTYLDAVVKEGLRLYGQVHTHVRGVDNQDEAEAVGEILGLTGENRKNGQNFLSDKNKIKLIMASGTKSEHLTGDKTFNPERFLTDLDGQESKDEPSKNYLKESDLSLIALYSIKLQLILTYKVFKTNVLSKKGENKPEIASKTEIVKETVTPGYVFKFEEEPIIRVKKRDY